MSEYLEQVRNDLLEGIKGSERMIAHYKDSIEEQKKNIDDWSKALTELEKAR